MQTVFSLKITSAVLATPQFVFFKLKKALDHFGNPARSFLQIEENFGQLGNCPHPKATAVKSDVLAGFIRDFRPKSCLENLLKKTYFHFHDQLVNAKGIQFEEILGYFGNPANRSFKLKKASAALATRQIVFI